MEASVYDQLRHRAEKGIPGTKPGTGSRRAGGEAGKKPVTIKKHFIEAFFLARPTPFFIMHKAVLLWCCSARKQQPELRQRLHKGTHRRVKSTEDFIPREEHQDRRTLDRQHFRILSRSCPASFLPAGRSCPPNSVTCAPKVRAGQSWRRGQKQGRRREGNQRACRGPGLLLEVALPP